MKSEHRARTTPRESRALNASPRISRLASKSKFLGKSWSRCARKSPRISPGITSRRRVNSRRGVSPMDKETSSPSPPRESVTEKNVGYSSPTVINAPPPHGYTWVDVGTRADVSISWLTNARRPSSCTVTLQHAATVGQPVDKLMSKANWRDRGAGWKNVACLPRSWSSS